MKAKQVSMALTLATAITLLAGACGSDGGSSGSASKTIELGLIGPYSGTYGDIGPSIEQGAQIAIDQLNAKGGIDGKKLKLVKSDDQGDPEKSAKAVYSLDAKNVNLTFGYAISPNCTSAAQAAERVKSLVMSASCSSQALIEGDGLLSSFFRVAPSDNMYEYATGQLVAKEYPQITTWNVIGPDYDVGHSLWERFQDYSKSAGVDVKAHNEVFHPLDASDLTPYITSVLKGVSKDEGLVILDSSSAMANMIKQGKSYDLFGKFGVVLNQGSWLPQAYALKQDVPEFWNVYKWASGAYDNEIASAFEKDFTAAYPGVKIDDSNVNGFTAVMAYAAAIEKAGSSEADKVGKALVGLSFDSIEGKIKIGDNHQAQFDMIARHFKPDPESPDGFTIDKTEQLPSGPK